MTTRKKSEGKGGIRGLYELKNDRYFQFVRSDILNAIPLENRGGRLLEIGAGECNTLVYAKDEGYASEVYGIELVERDIDNNVLSKIDGFAICDIQESPNPYKDTLFDVILCPDVLEHLTDPYSVVEKLAQWLRPDGIIIASIPNINHWRTLAKLIGKDTFAYSDTGILDGTHLRFFAGKDVRNLFGEHGFEVVEIRSNPGGGKGRWLLALTGALFRRFLTYQYVVIARPVTGK